MTACTHEPKQGWAQFTVTDGQVGIIKTLLCAKCGAYYVAKQ